LKKGIKTTFVQSCGRAIVTLAASLLLSASASAAELVTIGQVARATLTFAPIYAAIDRGYFAAENIEVKITEFGGSGVMLPQVANKSVTVGFPNADLLIISHQPGRDALPLKFFYNMSRGMIWEWAVPADRPIKTFDDLRGKTIAVGALGNGNIPIFKAMMKERGMADGKDYKLLPTGDGAPAFRATLNGDAAVYNANDVFVEAFAQTTSIRRLPVPDKVRGLFSNGFIAHVDTVREKPELLAGFGRAVAKGTLTCEANPAYCVRTFWKMYPAAKPEGNEAENLDKGIRMLNTRMRKYLYFPEGQPRKFGEYDAKNWQTYVDILHEGGQLETKSIDTSALYTNDLVSKINDFDAAKVKSDAAALK
jgi:NitT/TauT family transport system substrate-binding protein